MAAWTRYYVPVYLDSTTAATDAGPYYVSTDTCWTDDSTSTATPCFNRRRGYHSVRYNVSSSTEHRETILEKEVKMAIETAVRQAIRRETKAAVKKELDDLQKQAEKLKAEVQALNEERTEMKKQAAEARKEFTQIMREIEQAAETYQRKVMRFAMLETE